MDILLTILGVLGCVALMGAVMVLGPRLVQTKPVRSVMARLRSQTAIDRILSWVEQEKPDLGRVSTPDGTVTVLFSDIEDSTRLTERLGDERWLEVLNVHNTIVRAQVGEHGGYEVKSQGDGFMVAFPSARRAVRCAIDIQRALARRAAGGELPLRVRIGINTGEAIHKQGDFYGKSVILAARIADQAHGGVILVSSLVRELTEAAGDLSFHEAGEVELKGLSGSHRLFRVGVREPERDELSLARGTERSEGT